MSGQTRRLATPLASNTGPIRLDHPAVTVLIPEVLRPPGPMETGYVQV